jgi:hypothetical protein
MVEILVPGCTSVLMRANENLTPLPPHSHLRFPTREGGAGLPSRVSGRGLFRAKCSHAKASYQEVGLWHGWIN